LNHQEEADLVRQMESLQPDIFWIGLSTPKQERFMAAYLDKLAVRIMIGVGAAFDMHSGRVRQAPYWMQRSGLEWFFWFTQATTRLSKRYRIHTAFFVSHSGIHGLKRYSVVFIKRT
jgi:N-acetylglucosaminyldiphosphoundecaprenol N-acetyl-beta-D-mannosaminyltransferase